VIYYYYYFHHPHADLKMPAQKRFQTEQHLFATGGFSSWRIFQIPGLVNIEKAIENGDL